MQDVGTIIAILGDAITILQGTKREYQVPKSHVEGFNGSEVFLDHIWHVNTTAVVHIPCLIRCECYSMNLSSI